MAGRPKDFYVSGYEPAKIVKSSVDELWLMGFVCEDSQRRINRARTLWLKEAIARLLGRGESKVFPRRLMKNAMRARSINSRAVRLDGAGGQPCPPRRARAIRSASVLPRPCGRLS